jgi:epoxide hydrolase 4
MLALSETQKQAYRQVWARGLTGGLNYYRASPLMPVGETIKPMVLDKEKFKITMPTLVLWGMQDKALLPCLLEGLEEVVPHLTLERFENATHWLIHEEPARVNQAIAKFLAA